ncbi:FAD-dependent oxidoreductase [Aspergillus lucknowensis]|uniref:FAD-binding domain-containing protein n=1 Tax=Aspergillus lucknowensis TaxID=176173 RepID=A0ABR4LWZ8_9EURO
MPSSTPSTPKVSVVIVGAGIGGLTLAAFLRRLGISFVVLERTAVLTPQGAGISLAPNCLAALAQLGLYEKIARNAQELLGIRVYREKECWGTIDFGLAKRWFGYNVLSIERHEFHGYLYEAAGGEGVVRLGWNVADILGLERDNGDGVLRVVSDDGREIHADVVVGADGIRSVTRRILSRSIGLKSENTIRFTGRVHMSGYTQPLPHLSTNDLGYGHWMLYNDSILTTWPCKENRQWFIGVKRADNLVNPDRSVWKGATPDTVNGVYGEKFHPFGKDGTVKAIVDRSERVIASNVFEEADFPHMVQGRVALLGDAAHSMTSFFGQGACQAIEDATVLADSISLFLDGDKNALEAYSRVREKRAQEVANFSANYALLHTARLAPLGLGKLMRALVYRLVPSSAWMWYLEWLYGHQPVSKRR